MSVRRSVGPSVRPSVRNAFVKIAENGVMQDEGASRAVYPALFFASARENDDLFSIFSAVSDKTIGFLMILTKDGHKNEHGHLRIMPAADSCIERN